MHFDALDCSDAVVEKLWSKHEVEVWQVGEVVDNDPYIRRARDGLYHVYGRTDGGRYLFVVLRDLGGGAWQIVTARNMTSAERRRYQKQ